MIIREAVGMSEPVVTFVDLSKGFKECLPIGLGFEDSFLFILGNTINVNPLTQ